MCVCRMATSSDDPADDIDVPAVFVARADAQDLIALLTSDAPYNATLDSTGEGKHPLYLVSQYQFLFTLSLLFPVILFCA